MTMVYRGASWYKLHPFAKAIFFTIRGMPYHLPSGTAVILTGQASN